MPHPTPETRSTPTAPAWLDTARRFYARGFEVRTDAEMAGSVADWAELSHDEQTFTIAHLLYLHLVAQRGTHRLLTEVRDLLDEVAAGLADGDDGDADPNGGEGGPPDGAPTAAGEEAADADLDAPGGDQAGSGRDVEPATHEPAVEILDGEVLLPGEGDDGGVP